MNVLKKNYERNRFRKPSEISNALTKKLNWTKVRDENETVGGSGKEINRREIGTGMRMRVVAQLIFFFFSNE